MSLREQAEQLVNALYGSKMSFPLELGLAKRCVLEALLDAQIEGMTRYAHWKDGVQHVGTTGKTLKDAVAELRAREMEEG